MKTKDDLFHAGYTHILKWCELNRVEPPLVEAKTGRPDFGVCAYYRDGVIRIWVKSCAAIGQFHRAWSYPGYVTDRTPYGVLAHELGHHVDKQHGPGGGWRSHLWRPLDARPLTGYCPNDNEWFAELFRLFVTNPDLFRQLRPKLADLFDEAWSLDAEKRDWHHVLSGSLRHLIAADNKIKRVVK